MMIQSLEAFKDNFSERIMSLDDKERVDYLGGLFESIVVSQDVRDQWGDQLYPISDYGLGIVAKKAYKRLFLSGMEPGSWTLGYLEVMLKNALSFTRQMQENTYKLDHLVRSRSLDASAQAYPLLKEGVDFTVEELYTLAFFHQTSDTPYLVQRFLETRGIPTNRNINVLLAQDSEWTLDILDALRKTKMVFTKTNLDYALRCSGHKQVEIVQFLINQGVAATNEQLTFAKVHCDQEVVNALKSTLPAQTVDSEEGGLFRPEPRRKKPSPLKAALRKQDDSSVLDILHHLAKGKKLTSGDIKYWVFCPGHKSLTFLRIFLMYGVSLSDVDWKKLIDEKYPNLYGVVKLHLLYGYDLSDEVVGILSDQETDEKGDNLCLKALDDRPDKEKVYPKVNNFSSFANEFITQVPELFELLLISGVHPKLQHIAAFKKICKDEFFDLLLKDENFESNRYNQTLLDLAIESSTETTVLKLLNKGFQLTLDHVQTALFTQKPELTDSLSRLLIEQSKEKEDARPTEPVNKKDPIFRLLSDQNEFTAKELERFIEEGCYPREEHARYLVENPSLYAPGIFLVMIKSGLSL